MRSVFEPIGHLISRHPGAVAVGYLCLLLIALYGTTMITMNTGSGTYMDKSTEAGILFDTYTQTFDSNAVVLLIALLTGYTPKRSRQPSAGPGGYSRFLASMAVRIAHNPVPVILIAALVAFAGVQLDSSIPIDTNQNSFVPVDMAGPAQPEHSLLDDRLHRAGPPLRDRRRPRRPGGPPMDGHV